MNARTGQLFMEYRKKHKIKSGTRTGWSKLDSQFKAGMGQMILTSGKYGSRASHILYYAILSIDSEGKKNDCEEKMFKLCYMSIGKYGQLNTYPTIIRIGEHAIKRVFQRRPDIYNHKTEQFDIYKVISELQTVGYLAQLINLLFYYTTCRLLEKNIPLKNLPVPMVSQTGMFLGEYYHDRHLIEVRTFVADNQFTPDQQKRAHEIRSILQTSNLEMLAFMVYCGGDIVLNGVAFFAKLHVVAQQFARMITANEKDPLIKDEIQQIILSDFYNYQFLEPDELMNAMGKVATQHPTRAIF